MLTERVILAGIAMTAIAVAVIALNAPAAVSTALSCGGTTALVKGDRYLGR